MSARERTGRRDLAYSRWHRAESLVRYFLPFAATSRDAKRRAWSIGMIDIDAAEYCRYCNQTLALIETETTTERVRVPKFIGVMSSLAAAAGVPAYSVAITLTDCACGRDDRCDCREPEAFRVRRDPGGAVLDMSPTEYAHFLWSMRANHDCPMVRKHLTKVAS